jgi:hydroxypyruvate isomerase
MKFSTSITTMFKELEPLRRPAAAKAAGFDAIEIQTLDVPARDMAKAAQAAGVEVVLLNASMGDLRAGGPGLSGVPGREAQFAQEIARSIEVAQTLACKQIHAGASRLADGVARADALKAYRDNLLAAGERASKAGIRLLIEPINPIDLPGALLCDVREGASLVRDELQGRVGLQFDVYHVAMCGDEVELAFADCMDVIEHVQFSDIPGRVEPGAGSLDFASIFDAIEGFGYQGRLGAEYTPKKPTLQSLGWLKRFTDVVQTSD